MAAGSGGAARGCPGRRGGAGQRLSLALLLLHAAVLEPHLHLGVAEVQRAGHLEAAGPRQVAAEMKLLLQLRELPSAEASAQGVGWGRRAACNAEKHRETARFGGGTEGQGGGLGRGSRDESEPRPRPAATLTSAGRAPLHPHPLEGAGLRRGRPRGGTARTWLFGLRRRRAAAPSAEGLGGTRTRGPAELLAAGGRAGRVPRRPDANSQRRMRGAGRCAQHWEGVEPPPGAGGRRGPVAQPGREDDGEIAQVHAYADSTTLPPTPRRGNIALI